MMRKLLAALLLLLAGMGASQAHPSPSSEVMLEFRHQHVVAELLLPLDQLLLAYKQQLTSDAGPLPTAQAAAMGAYLAGHIRPVAPDGRAWVVQVQQLAVEHAGGADLRATVTLRPPKGAPLHQFDLEYTAISHEVPNHTVLVSLRKGWDEGELRPRTVLLTTLHWGSRTLAVRADDGAWWRAWGSLVQLGMEHIREGSDHLLFLFTLLIPAPLIRKDRRWGGFAGLRVTLRRLVAVVTAFTIGHSLTLAVGASGLVALPTQWVEALIAVSILISALHAWRPWPGVRETMLAGLFGLVHGLAFAATLTDMSLVGRQLLAAILAFNLGIELMQIGIVLAATPCLVILAQSTVYRSVRPTAAVIAAAAACAWLLERTLGMANPFNEVIDSLMQHGWIVLIAATLFAALAHYRTSDEATKRSYSSLLVKRRGPKEHDI